MECLECKVTEGHDSRASLRVVCLRFITNVEYGYIYANRMFSSGFTSPFAHLIVFSRSLILYIYNSIALSRVFFFFGSVYLLVFVVVSMLITVTVFHVPVDRRLFWTTCS